MTVNTNAFDSDPDDELAHNTSAKASVDVSNCNKNAMNCLWDSQIRHHVTRCDKIISFDFPVNFYAARCEA